MDGGGGGGAVALRTNLQDSIHQHRVDAERAHATILDRDATAVLALKLRGDPADILYALSLFEASNIHAVHPAVPSLLAHESAEVRVRAVALLSRTNVLSARREVEKLLRDPHLEVRTEALLYVTRHTNTDPLTLIEEVGAFPDFSIRASIIAFLARPGRAQNLEAAQLMLQRMVAETGDAGLRSRVEAAPGDRPRPRCLRPRAAQAARGRRARGGARSRALRRRCSASGSSPTGSSTASPSPGSPTMSSRRWPAMGDRIVGTLRDHLVDRDTPSAVRRELPAALQAIGTPAAQHVLTESMLDGDTVLRTRVLTALNKLVQMHPGRRFDRQIVETALAAEITGHYRSYQMLATIGASLSSAEPVVQALRESLDAESERIFRLLKILYPEHDLHSAFVGIQSDEPDVHDNALEFLDNILAPHVRALVVPLFDRASHRDARPRRRPAGWRVGRHRATKQSR